MAGDLERGIKKFIGTVDEISKMLEGLSGIEEQTVVSIDLDADVENDLNELDALSKKLKDIPKEILENHHKAMEFVANKLSQALDEAIMASVWQWTDDTRDIYDTGELMESKDVTYNRVTGSIMIEYGADYAGIVHEGGYVASGYNPDVLIYYPGRPWIRATLEGTNGLRKFPAQEIYDQYMREESE